MARGSPGCSISDVVEQPRRQQNDDEEEQRLGGRGTLGRGVGLKDGEGGGAGAAERCMALLLPKELSRRVFSQLDFRDLVQCSLVCKQWHLESTELRQGWKEEMYWEACSIRGVHFSYNSSASHSFPHLHLYLSGSPD